MQDNRFKKALLDSQTFAVTWELIPGRGARESAQDRALSQAGQAAAGDVVHALTLTDNPGGTPALSASHLGSELANKGVEPLVHFTCKDKNRNALESELYALDRCGIRNLLVMSGDYPVSGFQGRPAPVFDFDPIHVLQLISEMNRGLSIVGPKGIVRHQQTDFFAGAVVSPFKATQAEQLTQYSKLKKKIAAGAKFVVTQLGYDARKFHELLLFMKQHDLHVPLVGNIYILPFGAAKMMNRNELPGSVVTDQLLAELDRERNEPDKGLEARILRAARLYAVLKGMGYSGVHLGGHNIPYAQVEEIIRRGEALAPEWQTLVPFFDYPIPGGFYFYDRDPDTGLNLGTPVSSAGRSPASPIDLSYRLSRFFHALLFEPGSRLYKPMRRLARQLDGSRWESVFHKVERVIKAGLFDCRDCGDCALADVAYLCPMSQCPKNQRNGPCGGSFQGWCEVHPGVKQCIYVRAYTRLKRYAQESTLENRIVPPCNWDLFQRSSWINYYLGKDHWSQKQD